MDLNGCGCPGFSLTEKYRDAIINIYDNIGKLKFKSYQYKDFQEIISKNGISKESEIRMIVPFFRKAKIISQNSYQLNGDRICKLTISSNFFTQAGHIFITLLKLNKNNKELNNQSIKDVIERLYENICFLIFNNLCESDNDKNFNIYSQIFNFLLKYTTMDKYEFYILATFHNNIEKMQQTINEYRNSELEKTDFNIISNINDWSYITRLLEDLKIININNTENTYISLTDISKKWKKNA